MNCIQTLSLHLEIVFSPKKLKLYFRAHNISHFHVAETLPTPNFFHQLKEGYAYSPQHFLNQSIHKIEKGNEAYFYLWRERNLTLTHKINTLLDDFMFSEPHILFHLLKVLPQESHIHLANSMSVRWLNIIGLPQSKKFVIQSNRGVSGIDGSTSTALGYSIYSRENNFLITGDIAFFYDRNAFWNSYIPKNFKIILLNNHEGGIFNMIPGPGNKEALLPYFTSSQNLSAKHLSKEFNLNYYYVKQKGDLDSNLKEFINTSGCSILELKTDSSINKEVLEQLKNLV